MTARYIPLRRTKKEATEAISRYARRHNMFPRSVRNSTMSHFAAMLEDDVRRKAISLGVARSQFAARYPDTRKAGPMHARVTKPAPKINNTAKLLPKNPMWLIIACGGD